MTDLTPRQLEVLEFIKSYIKCNRFAPLHTEIANSLNMSRQSVGTRMVELQAKGYIVRGAGQRNVSLTEKAS